MNARLQPWTVLLIGGTSGTGKTTAAATLGRDLGVSWLQADDLRLILQFSGLVPKKPNPDLYFFLDHELRDMTADLYRDKLIAVGRIVSRALRVVIDHHIATNTPVILEGDGIVPEHAVVYARAHNRRVRSVFVTERDENVLYRNVVGRGRGIKHGIEASVERQTHIHGSWLFGQWLEHEVAHYGLPSMPARPYDSLAKRMLSVIE